MGRHMHTRRFVRGRVWVWVCAAAAVGCVAGDPKPTGPPRGGQIGHMVTLMSPHAVNWDNDPAYDGLSLFMLFFSAGRGEAMAVDGTLTFFLYSGSKRTPTSKPFHQWVFTPEQLEGRLRRSTYGWCYGFRLDWKDHVPTTPAATLVAQFRAKGGRVHYSRDSVVRTGVRR